MRITRTDVISPADSLVLIGPRESRFEDYLKNNSERKFVRDTLKDEKEQLTINQFRRQVFIQVMDNSRKKTSDEINENLRTGAARLISEIRFYKIRQLTVILLDGSPEAALAFAEGLALANYQFLKYLKDKEKKKSFLEEIRLVLPSPEDRSIAVLNNIIEAVYLARDLVNEPLSSLNAGQLAGEIEKMGKISGFRVEILNRKKIESLKMGGLLAVNRGSIDPPTFSILEYKPAGAKNKKPVILVGKGIVFDTGGLSLKPTSDSMDYMKSDMSGAAAVAGIFYVIAKSNIPGHLIGLVPATANRPDGIAYVPGDVITMYDGTTVEVLNTDAEGRMILADALAYAKNYDPELVINLATLTGSAAAAIGNLGIVMMGNAGRKIKDKLIMSGSKVYERIAEFPFWNDYADQLKSDIADLKNIGSKYGGAITAGKFLEHFTDYPFIHLDIAGPAFSKKHDSYRGTGASGTGVRLIVDFLRKYISR